MTLQQFNQLDKQQLKSALTGCCGSATWIEKMMHVFPVADQETLLGQAESTWFTCNEEDWIEAFTHHPKIGDVHLLMENAATDKWAEEEQSAVKQTSDAVLQALKTSNQEYEARFGYIFIVCASGRSAEEMLGLLHARLHHAASEEILIAMTEQNKITLLRIKKLLTA